MAQERKRRSLPRIPELELLSRQDDETFLPSSPGASGGPQCQPKSGSASRPPHSPIFFPSNSPTFLTRLRVNRSIQEHHRKFKGW
ncbi:NADH:ubiquinone oxidoreductase subunit N [Platysternon megacephalum]|uniref:NADH:ubiquinone oxidoreductase subunit N n=1 Tax=Platysternon megacephalum TaxID=55544 RepID=A0A4D9DPW1_9SAUR|nr:NADH:ubiquinone oxidoreductase subunit N [Platysternon megacephalum]